MKVQFRDLMRTQVASEYPEEDASFTMIKFLLDQGADFQAQGRYIFLSSV